MIPSNRPFWRVVKPDTAPAAGDEFTLRANKGGGWLVKSLRFVLEASAAVADRTAALEVTDGDQVLVTFAAHETIAATESGIYQAFPGIGEYAANAALISVAWPHGGLWLPQGYALRSVTFNMDVADQYSEIVARVVEYPSGSERELFPFGPATALPSELT
jgi:hypothetical protein